jgi:hypothetical protein
MILVGWAGASAISSAQLARLIHGGIEFLAEYGAHPFDTAHHSGSDRG